MRSGTEVLQTSGDDPLLELAELDEYYGWSRRIASLMSVFRERRKHNLPVFIAIFTFVAGSCLIGAYFVLTL